MWRRIILILIVTLAALAGGNYSLDLASYKSNYSLLGFVLFLLCAVIWIKLIFRILKKYTHSQDEIVEKNQTAKQDHHDPNA